MVRDKASFRAPPFIIISISWVPWVAWVLLSPLVAWAQDPSSEKRIEALAQFLVKPAQEALARHDYGRAISLHRGLIAIRGEDSELVWPLAESWEAKGAFDAAIDELERYKTAVRDPEQRKRAEEKIASLQVREAGFTAGRFSPTPAAKEAQEAFRRGRIALKARRFAEAVLLFKAGIEMAPDVPGAYRELGFAYRELGREAEAREFFVRYLRMRPFGKNADQVRPLLAKANLLGKLRIESSPGLECEQVWIRGQMLPAGMHLPLELSAAPGRYKVLCYHEKLHFARFLSATVTPGQTATVSFLWAVIENRLEPWGRIVVEHPDPDHKGEMQDIGLWREVGVPVPDGGRALDAVLVAGDGSRKERMSLRLAPGKRLVVKWP